MKETKFQPGQSGNSKGRPKGKSLKATELRKAIEAKADDILQAVIDAAINGDMSAAKLLIDRVCPSLKPEAMAISLPVKSTLVEQGAAIVKATMGGNISPDVGTALITALANQSRIVEIDELTKRMEILEGSR